jgi:23S rRNA C2498 (ribose-2'-O)-methylase RlmM
MNPALFQQPFIQVALPIMVTLVVTVWTAQWAQNKRFDDLRQDMNRRLDEVIARLDRIERKLDNRIIKLEERTSPIGRAR